MNFEFIQLRIITPFSKTIYKYENTYVAEAEYFSETKANLAACSVACTVSELEYCTTISIPKQICFLTDDELSATLGYISRVSTYTAGTAIINHGDDIELCFIIEVAEE